MEAQNQSKRRTACYARVSTADQKNGLDAQIRALRIFCEQNKITEWELFADENQSGTKASRPSLDRMMAAVENGEIENVIVFAFSRYARSVSHMLKGLEIMRKHKTNFISLTEKLDLNTSLGHVVFVIISAIAQLERDLIAERVKNGLAAAKARGKQIGRVRKRNSALIESLLDAGLSFREISRIAKCSHGSVSAQKKEYLAKKAKQKADEAKVFESKNQEAVQASREVFEITEPKLLPTAQTATPPDEAKSS
ncbi:MAG: recombinase family protein [Bdellovibrionales bacterium]